MARRKKEETSIANWDEELARLGKESLEQEASALQGSFFSIRGGQLSFNGAPLPNNEVAVVILDAVLENIYYDTDFDPEQATSPACYAFGRGAEELAPHPDAPRKQAELCSACPQNEWGSSKRRQGSRGKACSNKRRLALLPAGGLDAQGKFTPLEDPALFEGAQLGLLKLPVTSVKAYGQYLHTVLTVFKVPHQMAVFTRISVEPDPKNQVRVNFEHLGNVPKALLPVLMQRQRNCQDEVVFAYAEGDEQPAAPKPSRSTKKAGGKGKRGPAKPRAQRKAGSVRF